MSEKGRCPKCGNENEYSKINCDFCGARLPWAAAMQGEPTKPSAASPVPQSAAPALTATQTANAQSCGKITGGCLGVFVLLFVCLWIYGSMMPKTFSDSLAYYYAQNEIRNKLKAPSSAVFPPLGTRGVMVRKVDDQFYVYSYVDAQNSYGAPLRQRWYAMVKPAPDNTSAVVTESAIVP